MATVIFLGVCIRDVRILFRAEPWAEQIGTAYYLGTHGSFIDALFTKEAGYLHLIKRIVALLIAQTSWGRIHYVFLTNLFTVLVIALGCALFILPERVFGFEYDKLCRVICICYIPFILLCNRANFLYIDLGYWGIMYFIYFLFFYDLESMCRWKFICLCVILMLFCLTTGHFVCFLPLVIIECLIMKT